VADNSNGEAIFAGGLNEFSWRRKAFDPPPLMMQVGRDCATIRTPDEHPVRALQ
jgi:hypothetical protein